MLNDDSHEMAPELDRTLEGLHAGPLVEHVAQVLHPSQSREGPPVPHDLPGPLGLQEGNVHLLPPGYVVPHP